MTRAQIFVLAILAILVCIVFGVAAVTLRASLVSPPAVADQPAPTASLTIKATPTWTPNPTWTPSPTPPPTNTLLPTPTNTRVVLDTATPTPSSTPTVTPTPTITPTPAKGRSGGGTTGGAPPTPQPTSRYPLKIIEGPLTYETKNYFFVVYARVSSGGALLPGYRMVGTHRPTGVNLKSEPSCSYLCKASGPKKERYFIQEGNLAFEGFFYDTGTWSLMLIDPQGQQASEILNIDIDKGKRVWFYYHFGR